MRSSFYSSVRLDIRRIESIKEGQEVVGSRVRVKVVKNKMAPPFKQAEFDILSQGISGGRVGGSRRRSESVEKSGAWYSYHGERLGQGRDAVRDFWSRISRWPSRSKASSASWPACRAAASKSLPRNPCSSRPKRTSATRSDLTKSESDGRILLRRKRETAHPQSGDEWFHRAVRYSPDSTARLLRSNGFSPAKALHRPRSHRLFPVCLRCGTFDDRPMPHDGSRRRWHAGRWDDRLKSELMAKGLVKPWRTMPSSKALMGWMRKLWRGGRCASGPPRRQDPPAHRVSPTTAGFPEETIERIIRIAPARNEHHDAERTRPSAGLHPLL